MNADWLILPSRLSYNWLHMHTEKNLLAATGIRFSPFLTFCLLIGVPRQISWPYEGHSEIELREIKGIQPILQAN